MSWLMKNDLRPEAYRTGGTRFCGLDLLIDERVFVPNPETELLAGLVSSFMAADLRENGLLLDVGTGSGNLAITLAGKHPGWRVTGTDISADALAVAATNVARHGLKNICLACTDLVLAIDEEPAVIVCNLPWGRAEYMLKSNSAEGLAFMPPVAIYPVNGVIGAYLRLAEQVSEKGWHTVIFAEVGRIPEGVIQKEMPGVLDWAFCPLTPDYAALKITF
jgi:release factor glutamine methyltransferase